MKKLLYTCFFSLVIFVGTSANAFATPAKLEKNETIINEVAIEKDEIMSKEYIDIIQENPIVIYGSKPPTGTSYLNIINNNYNFDVTSMKIKVFTNTFFKGAKKVKVKVDPISVNKNGMQNKSLGITVHLMKKGASTDVAYNVPLNGTSFYYTNLDPDALYYLKFTKQNDSQIYSFKGSITNAK